MSHSLDADSDQQTPALREARAAHARMIRQGRSFSGRERNCAYLNLAAGPAPVGQFANVSAATGFDFPDDGRAISLIDWDHDGDVDVWVSNRNTPQLRFLRNETGNDHAFLALRLQGNGTSSNRDGIGARVEVVVGNEGPQRDEGNRRPQRRVKTLRAGEGFLAQSTKWLHFGLGDAIQPATVTVKWPGGSRDVFPDVPLNGRYLLVQGGAAPQPVSSTERELCIAAGQAPSPAVSEAVRIRLPAQLQLPDMYYVDLQQELKPLPIRKGRWLLVNLWATWCAPCRAELAEFQRRQGAWEDAGIDILGLSVDGLGDQRASSGEAARLMNQADFELPSGYATPDLIAGLQAMHDHLISATTPLPIPCSFLIDAEGQLSVLYKGPVDVDALRDDQAFGALSPAERLRSAAVAPGSVIDHPLLDERSVGLQLDRGFEFAKFLIRSKRYADAAEQLADCLRLGEHALLRSNLGVALERLNRPDLAADQFRRALELDPDSAETHRNLAAVLDQTGRRDLALEHLHHAVRLDPSQPRAQLELGTILLAEGRAEEAIASLEAAVAHAADAWGLREALAKAYYQAERYDRAADEYRAILEHDPENLDALNNTAWLLATSRDEALRDGAAAVELGLRAARLTDFKEAGILDTYAAALAEAGDFSEAARRQREAIRRLPASQKAAAERRLKLYEQRLPYRQPEK